MDIDYNIAEAIHRIQEKEKANKWRRLLVSSEIEEAKKHKFALHHGYKATIPSKKIKAVRTGNKLYSDTEALRLIMLNEVERILKRNALWRGTADFKMLSLFFPFIVKTGFYANEPLYRVDIKACFYTIYSIAGLDARVRYDYQDKKIKYIAMGQGRMTRRNSELIYSIGTRKDIRNIVYGLTRSCFCNVWKSNHWNRIYFKSELLNVELHGFIVLLLHAIVNKIQKEADIIYWNIDGGFIRNCNIDRIADIFNDLGFTLKHEPIDYVDIAGIGSYEYKTHLLIHQTGHYKHGVKSSNKINIYTVEEAERVVVDYKKLYNRGKL